MIKLRVLVLLQTLAMGFAGGVEAQSLQTLQVGNRIRVQIAPSRDWRVGRYDGLAHDTLWIGQCNDCLAGLVPLGRINELDLSEGMPRSRAKQVAISTLIGLATGAIGGGILANSTKSPCDVGPGSCWDIDGSMVAAFFGLVGGAVGAGMGALLPTPHEHWRKIPLS